MKALSIRQPWAWLIVNGHKDIENRTWPTKVRGRVLVHAGLKMTRMEYVEVAWYAKQRGVILPEPRHLQLGGIVGSVEITDCVDEPYHETPWFEGPYGFVLADARVEAFHPWPGKLGFFDINCECHARPECAK